MDVVMDAVERFDTAVSRRQLVASLSRLRYSGSVLVNLTSTTDEWPESEFNEQVTAFLTEFGRILESVSDTTTTMAAELAELRSQRKAVRDFLGLPNHLEGGS